MVKTQHAEASSITSSSKRSSISKKADSIKKAVKKSVKAVAHPFKKIWRTLSGSRRSSWSPQVFNIDTDSEDSEADEDGETVGHDIEMEVDLTSEQGTANDLNPEEKLGTFIHVFVLFSSANVLLTDDLKKAWVRRSIAFSSQMWRSSATRAMCAIFSNVLRPSAKHHLVVCAAFKT
jgi:hypothetical protein